VCQCTYSVPARFAGRRLTVWLGASTIEVLDGATTVAWHERAVGKFLDVLTLDHHLEVLKTKPGALPGATALVQGRRSGVFTSLHQACRDAARAAKGDACGTRWLIEVLLAHRTRCSTSDRSGRGALGAGVGEAVGVGAGLQDVAGEGEPVHDRGAQPGVGEGLRPAGEGFVAGRRGRGRRC